MNIFILKSFIHNKYSDPISIYLNPKFKRIYCIYAFDWTKKGSLNNIL